MAKIKFGWSEVNLMPEGAKVNLVGQFYERITTEVETPVTVTALAMDSGNDAAIFCSCDLVDVGEGLLRSVRACLQDRPDIPAEKVMVGAIHTHTAPGYAQRSDGLGASVGSIAYLKSVAPEANYIKLVSETEGMFEDWEAHNYMAEQIAKAVIQAWDSRAEGAYAPGFGRAAVGLCRRVCYDDGSAKMWGDTTFANFTELEAGNDSGIELLFIYDSNKKLTGVMANVACPAQVLEHRNFVSSDYWGKVKEYLRKELGEDLYVLGLCSAAGDQCPRDMIRWVEPETPINDPNVVRIDPVERKADPSMFDLKGCRLVGRRIATEILFALEEVDTYIEDAPFEHRAEKLTMPVRRVTIAERDAAEKAIREFLDKNGLDVNYKDSAALHVYCGTIARYEVQQSIHTVDIEVHFLRLGNIAFATNPYELFLDYGNKIRTGSKASQTFLWQLSCGAWGYLPTLKAEQGSHYSAYVSSGTVGHEGGDLLVRKSVQEINDMLKA